LTFVLSFHLPLADFLLLEATILIGLLIHFQLSGFAWVTIAWRLRLGTCRTSNLSAGRLFFTG